MQNVRHVFEIATAILKFKITVTFNSKIITNFALTLILQNMQTWTSVLFTVRQISFLVYPEVCSCKIFHSVGTYLPTAPHGVITQKKEISQFKVIKEILWTFKKEFYALKLIEINNKTKLFCCINHLNILSEIHVILMMLYGHKQCLKSRH